MRFDEFVKKHGITVLPVDMFPGFVTEVGVPPGWEPFDSAPGLRVWVCRTDPLISKFCANAVLTMHRVEASLDPHEVFATLAEQQLESVPRCHELHRKLAAATEGAGVVGTLAMQISHELGIVDSVARTRIISPKQETLIAQLTVTALRDSPANRAHVWLSVQTGAGRGSAPIGDSSAASVTEMKDGR